MKRHVHHIVPKHLGGDNSADNLTPPISLSLHAALHRDLWENLNNIEDFIAWKALSGLISSEDARIAAVKAAAYKTRGIPKSKSWRKFHSDSMKKYWSMHLGELRPNQSKSMKLWWLKQVRPAKVVKLTPRTDARAARRKLLQVFLLDCLTRLMRTPTVTEVIRYLGVNGFCVSRRTAWKDIGSFSSPK